MGNGGFFLPVRVFYRKEGRIKYISHLDMNRCVSRALRRSGLPAWRTQGFNPHVYITFALPLSLGYESVCESFDFRLTEEMPMERVAECLRSVLPEGLTVYDVRTPELKPESIAFAEYGIELEFDHGNAAAVEAALREWLNGPELLVRKQGKKGERVVDVKSHVTLMSAASQGGSLRLSLRTAASQTFSLNPTLLLDAFGETCPASEKLYTADWMRVVRTGVFDENGAVFA